MKSRLDKIKKGLDSDIYNKLSDIENLSDDTLTSTESLADILEGYETKVDGMDFTKPLEELEILDEEDIEIEIDNEEILHDYNNQVHGVGLNTLDDLLNSPTPSYTEDLAKVNDINTEDFNNDVANVDDMETQEIFTQNLTSPEAIDNFDLDDVVVEPEEVIGSRSRSEKAPGKSYKTSEINKQSDHTFDIKNHIVDIILVIILIALVYFLITSNMGA